MAQSEFFPRLKAPPKFAPKPQDEHLEQRISKLAEFAQKNGPPFVNMIKEKQRGNSEYSFLEDGPGAEYFTWKLYCFQFSLNPGMLHPLKFAFCTSSSIHMMSLFACRSAFAAPSWASASPPGTQSGICSSPIISCGDQRYCLAEIEKLQ